MRPTIPNLWMGSEPEQGHYGFHEELSDGRHILGRDRAGVNKLFFGVDDDGTLHSSNYVADLLDQGMPYSRVSSVPPGSTIVIDSSTREYEIHRPAPLTIGGTSAKDSARKARAHMNEVFDRLAEAFPRGPIYVAFSGGLDSTVILNLALQRWDDVVAVTFGVEDENGNVRESEDLVATEALAKHFGVRREVVTATPKDMLDSIDEVLVKGQDFRDFNVHCAMVNYQVARGIRRLSGGAPAVVLTGDGMNELTSDYSQVEYQGRTHYALPRMRPSAMRRFLVEGLDAGDREVGIYAAHGIQCIQPYLMALEPYLGLDASIVDRPMGKQLFARLTWGARLPEMVYNRPKVRAQEGSSGTPTGSMAVALDAGFDSDGLRRRFCELLGITDTQAKRFVRGGHYETLDELPLFPRERRDLAVIG